MLGKPVARIAQPIRRSGEVKTISKSIPDGRPFGDRRLIKNAETNGNWPNGNYFLPPPPPPELRAPPPIDPPAAGGALRAPEPEGEPPAVEPGALEAREGAALAEEREAGDCRDPAKAVGPLAAFVKPDTPMG